MVIIGPDLLCVGVTCDKCKQFPRGDYMGDSERWRLRVVDGEHSTGAAVRR